MNKNFQTSLPDAIENALNGNYNVDVDAVLKEAWHITQSDKRVMVAGIFLLVVIVVLTLQLMPLVTGYQWQQEKPLPLQFALDIGMLLITVPFVAALVMLGVNQSRGKIATMAALTQYLPQTLLLALTAIISGIVVQLGLLLFILPGLYLLVATGFAVPLVLDKGLSPMQAVIISIRVVNQQWKAFVKLYLILTLLTFFLSLITFGIALIWLMPLYYNAKGILYRDIFTEAGNNTSGDNDQHSESEQDTGFYA